MKKYFLFKKNCLKKDFMSLGPLGLMIEHIRGVTKGSKYCKDF